MRNLRPRRMASILSALMLIQVGRSGADEGSDRSSARVRIAAHLTVTYEYHYDRNALRTSERVGDALVAVSDSGNLLRFDFATHKLTRERFGPSRVVCLGRGERDVVLAGLEDGRICRVDPGTLNLTEVVRLKDRPQWIGPTAGGLVAVVERSKLIDVRGRVWVDRYSAVVDIASGKSYEDDRLASTFHLDHKRRVWLGGDRGEWGGSCTLVDLDAGTRTSIKGLPWIVKGLPPRDHWDGIYGFVELADGQVWAHGGTLHLGTHEAFVRRVDRGKGEELYLTAKADRFRSYKADPKPERPSKPYLPITHIVADGPDSLLVLSYGELFRTDPKLGVWNRVRDIDLQYRVGRPDAVSPYPAIRAVHKLDGPGGGLLCATGLDGYVLIGEGKPVFFTLPGQLGTDRIVRADTVEGQMRFREWNDEVPAWRFRDGRWTQDAPAARDEGEDKEPLRLNIQAPEYHEPTRLCRDASGRFWLAWMGLWMFDPASCRLHALGSLPMIGRTEVRGVDPDTRGGGGVVVSLSTTPQRKGIEIMPPRFGSALEGPRSARTWP